MRYELKELPADFVSNWVVIDLYSDGFELFDIESEARAYLKWANS